MQHYLAIDIGASSGRHILSHVEDGKMILQEVFRFDNNLETRDGHLCWNTVELFANIMTGIKKCRELGTIPVTIGIDTWGVDFVLLDSNDHVLGDTVAYRDARTVGMDTVLDLIISEPDLYSITGIQKQLYNTIYQLLAIKESTPEILEKAESILLMPDYFGFLLTGQKKNEYTEATTSGLVNARSKTWDMDLISKIGLPEHLFTPRLYPPGTVVGLFSAEIQAEAGFCSTVVLPATHDTGSAFMAVPARDGDAVYMSSGTWTLLGVELDEPITTETSRQENFTNEGGYNYCYRFLKNVMGLWMIQSIRRNLDKKYSFAELEQMAKEAGDFPSIVDPNDFTFFAPASMIEAVKEYCRRTSQTVPESIGEVVQCVYSSLSKSYASAIRNLAEITGKTFTSINIVGGGSKDVYLNALTARETGLPVFAGPTEGTALGNIMCQMLTAWEYKDLPAARAAIKNSFTVAKFEPLQEEIL